MLWVLQLLHFDIGVSHHIHYSVEVPANVLECNPGTLRHSQLLLFRWFFGRSITACDRKIVLLLFGSRSLDRLFFLFSIQQHLLDHLLLFQISLVFYS